MWDDVNRTVEAVWRMEAAQVGAVVARTVGDVGVADEAAQAALRDAYGRWSRTGVPDAPGAWLTATARRHAVERLRRGPARSRAVDRRTRGEEARAAGEVEASFDDVAHDVTDEVLRLIFTVCHPVNPLAHRVALTLRMVAGLTPADVAEALGTGESAAAEQVVRATAAIRDAGVRLEVPSGDELVPRLRSVLEVLDEIFALGEVATARGDRARGELMGTGLRLGRVLAGLVPGEPEVHGLLALMKLHASRTGARTAARGEPVPVYEQDRTRWDWLLVRNGLASIARAKALRADPGPYVLRAEIAACHARAVRPEDTDWVRIVILYAELTEQQPSPRVEVSRAVALSHAVGPEAALPVIEAVAGDPSLAGDPVLPAVRGDLLRRAGRDAEAAAELRRAAALTATEGERRWLIERAERAEAG